MKYTIESATKAIKAKGFTIQGTSIKSPENPRSALGNGTWGAVDFLCRNGYNHFLSATSKTPAGQSKKLGRKARRARKNLAARQAWVGKLNSKDKEGIMMPGSLQCH